LNTEPIEADRSDCYRATGVCLSTSNSSSYLYMSNFYAPFVLMLKLQFQDIYEAADINLM